MAWSRREFLNPSTNVNDTGSIQAIVGENPRLVIRDCSRQIELNFSVNDGYDKAGLDERVAKLDLMIEVLKDFRRELRKAHRARV